MLQPATAGPDLAGPARRQTTRNLGGAGGPRASKRPRDALETLLFPSTASGEPRDRSRAFGTDRHQAVHLGPAMSAGQGRQLAREQSGPSFPRPGELPPLRGKNLFRLLHQRWLHLELVADRVQVRHPGHPQAPAALGSKGGIPNPAHPPASRSRCPMGLACRRYAVGRRLQSDALAPKAVTPPPPHQRFPQSDPLGRPTAHRHGTPSALRCP